MHTFMWSVSYSNFMVNGIADFNYAIVKRQSSWCRRGNLCINYAYKVKYICAPVCNELYEPRLAFFLWRIVGYVHVHISQLNRSSDKIFFYKISFFTFKGKYSLFQLKSMSYFVRSNVILSNPQPSPGRHIPARSIPQSK